MKTFLTSRMLDDRRPQLSIRNRLIILFTLHTIIIMFAGGFYLNWRLENTLEEELALKLENLAQAAALQLDPDLLTSLAPGDENTRTFRTIAFQINTFRDVTGVRRVYIFDSKRHCFVDTRHGTAIGQVSAFIPLTTFEITELFEGKSVSSTLFEGSDGRLYKAGFAPVISGDKEIIAALAVEGSADTFESLRSMRRDLFALAVLVLVASVVLSVIFSRTITTSIERLKESARTIARGDYAAPVAVRSTDEVGFLGRTMEEMRQAIVRRDLRQKTMLAGVAHEIRNPLGGIELFAGLLAGELPEGKAKEESRKIQKEVQNLKQIVSDFLNYARPRAARKEPCDIRAIYDEVRGLLSTELEQVKCTFIQNTDEATAFVDASHLRQIFLNLIKNAAEAMQRTGALKVEVQANEGSTILVISDTGPGIPGPSKARIFEPFYTTRSEGTGLGLAIVQTLVEENGGEIEVLDSAEGAAFRLEFTNTD